MFMKENLEIFNHCRFEDHFSSMILPEAACVREMSRYVLSNPVFQVANVAVFVIRRFELADIELKFGVHDAPRGQCKISVLRSWFNVELSTTFLVRQKVAK
jgi:hypothetical protein